MNEPCPVCKLTDGFHDDKIHKQLTIPVEHLKEKGWHTK